MQHLGRLRLRLGKNYLGSGSGSGSEQNVPAALAPAPGMRSFLITVLHRHPGIVNRQYSLCVVFVAKPTSAVEHSPTYYRSGEHRHFLITVLHRHPGNVYRQYSLCAVFVAKQHLLSNTVRRITALVSIGIFNYCFTSPSRNCLPAVFNLCRVRSQATSAVEHSPTYNRSGEHRHFLITVLHRHPAWVKLWKYHWWCKLELVPTYIPDIFYIQLIWGSPPEFEEGHFHGFSRGETKILMNRNVSETLFSMYWPSGPYTLAMPKRRFPWWNCSAVSITKIETAGTVFTLFAMKWDVGVFHLL